MSLLQATDACHRVASLLLLLLLTTTASGLNLRIVLCGVERCRYQVQWPCCLQKGLPYRLMKPNHHTNVSLSPLESEIIEEQ